MSASCAINSSEVELRNDALVGPPQALVEWQTFPARKHLEQLGLNPSTINLKKITIITILTLFSSAPQQSLKNPVPFLGLNLGSILLDERTTILA